MSTEKKQQQFKESLQGELIREDDERYDECRKVYNAMIDRRPRMIAYCTDVADVIAAVRFGREDGGMPVAIRGGGHNVGGLGLCDDGLVIDLSRIRYTHVDPKAGTVRVGGGATWRDVDHATHAYGLAVPSGTISTTGVGGLTLGGGLGHLTRKYGLTVDNMISADVVLADGRSVTASAEENEDLFWALRGGGGNFGVVTSFLFRGRPVDTVYAGPTLWTLEQAPEIMEWYREFILRAPYELGGFFAFLVVPSPPFPENLGGKKMCGIVWCYSGPQEKAEEVFEPIRAVGPPAFEHLGPMPFPALQRMFDPLYPPGLQMYWRADFVNELSDDAISANIANAQKLPTALSAMHFFPIDGAAHEVGRNETPWAYRDANWAQVMAGVDPDPANKEKISKWVRDYWDALHPFSAGGAYVNFMMEEGDERVRTTYRDNYERLAAVKKTYDPDNFFRVNQNIRPAA